MAMVENQIDLYGILVPEEVMKRLAEKLCDGYSEEAYAEDSFDFDEEVAAQSEGGIIRIGDFSGYASLISPEKELAGLRQVYEDESFYHIPLQKAPSLFKAAYSSMEEVIAEVKESAKDLLPEDFDYTHNLCHFVGSTFG